MALLADGIFRQRVEIAIRVEALTTEGLLRMRVGTYESRGIRIACANRVGMKPPMTFDPHSAPFIILIDPYTGGHHDSYLKLFQDKLLELGCNAIVLCAEPDRVRFDELQRFVYKLEKRSGNPIPRWFKRLRRIYNALSYWHNVAKAVKRLEKEYGKVDFVFFAWLDSYLSTSNQRFVRSYIENFFGYQWSGLYFHPQWLRQKEVDPAEKGKGFIKTLSLKNCLGVCVLDEGVEEKFSNLLHSDRVFRLPDFTDGTLTTYETDLSIKICQHAQGRLKVGVIGILQKRKGTMLLLEAAQLMRAEPFSFYFCGHLRPGYSEEQLSRIHAEISSENSNCLFHLERIENEEEFNAAFNELDIVFAVYENFQHSSNLLSKAALFHKPIIVSDGFCMAERVRRYNLGYVMEDKNVSHLVDILRNYNNTRSNLVPDYAGYLAFQDPAQIGLVFEKLIKNLSVQVSN